MAAQASPTLCVVLRGQKRICGRKSQSYTTATVSENCPKLPEVAFSKSDPADFRNSLNEKPPEGFPGVSNWVQGLDLNQRPSGYEPDELPGCSTLQQREGQRATRRPDCQRHSLFQPDLHLGDAGSR